MPEETESPAPAEVTPAQPAAPAPKAAKMSHEERRKKVAAMCAGARPAVAAKPAVAAMRATTLPGSTNTLQAARDELKRVEDAIKGDGNPRVHNLISARKRVAQLEKKA